MPQYVVTITQNDAASVHNKSMMLLLYTLGGVVVQAGAPISPPLPLVWANHRAITPYCCFASIDI